MRMCVRGSVGASLCMCVDLCVCVSPMCDGHWLAQGRVASWCASFALVIFWVVVEFASMNGVCVNFACGLFARG